LRAIFDGLVAAVFPKTSPVEVFAKAARGDMETAWAPVLEQTQVAIEKLKEEFEAVSLTHSTEKPGFRARLKMYQAAGLSESEMANIERTSVGAVHQALRRIPRDEEPPAEKDENEGVEKGEGEP
jgi:DNA-directed RNA polymerase specialized sigma24 family protein